MSKTSKICSSILLDFKCKDINLFCKNAISSKTKLLHIHAVGFMIIFFVIDDVL